MYVQMQAFGKVERDPELVVTKGGIPFTEFPLAVNTKRCVENITVRLTCQAWGDEAESIQRSVTTGALLFVQGHFTPLYWLLGISVLLSGKKSLKRNVSPSLHSGDGKENERIQPSSTLHFRTDIPSSQHSGTACVSSSPFGARRVANNCASARIPLPTLRRWRRSCSRQACHPRKKPSVQ
jgi:primosomal replication protein N